MKSRFLKTALFVVLVFPVLTGCWNMRELEHMFYAHAVGIDYVDGQYRLYVQILDFSALGKQESGGGKSGITGGAWVGRGTGKSIQSAIHQLYATSQRRIFWGHVSSVVVSEKILKLGIHEVLDQLTRYNEFRYTLRVFGTRGSVEEVLLTSPIMESSPVYSQLGDPQDVYNQSSFIQPKRLNRMIVEMREPGKTLMLPLITISKGSWVDNKQRYSALEIEGVGMITEGKWKGWLSKDEVKGIRWVERSTGRTPLVIDSEEQPVAAIIFEHPNPTILPEVRNGKVFFNVKITVKGSIGEMGREASESFITSRSEDLIRKEIRRTYLEGIKHKTDILNLLDSIYRKNLKEWSELIKNKEFPLDAESLKTIDVKVRITNSGRTLKSFPKNSNPQGEGRKIEME